MSYHIDIEAVKRSLKEVGNTFASDTTPGERIQAVLLCDIAQSLRRIAHILEEKTK